MAIPRVIKFRAWDVTDEIMFKPDGFSFEMGISAITVKEVGKLINPNEMSNTYKVMQFTGLLDRNGKEVFEGDIVKWNDDYNEGISVVKWGSDDSSTASAYPAFDLFPNVSDELNSFAYLDFEGKIEVIGNIYENSDLLLSPTLEPPHA